MRKNPLKHLWSLALGTATLTALGASIVTAQANTILADHIRAAPGSVSHARPVVKLHQHQVTITIHNFKFGPPNLVVSRNTRIVWTNTDSDPHTVTSDKKVWASDALDNNTKYIRVFKTAGTFPYHCAIHPYMHGVITVKP